MDRPVRIYLAGSWRLAPTILDYARYLRRFPEFDVDAFCDHMQDIDPITALRHPTVGPMFRQAFAEDKKKLDWSDCIIMMQPCGNSSHMEGGYARGAGKHLFIYWMSDPIPETFDNMYQFADKLFYPNQLFDLVQTLKDLHLLARIPQERWTGC